MDILLPVSLATARATPRLPMAAASDPTGGMGRVSGLFLLAGIIAALITGTINLTLARRRSREEERARVRTTFAEAFRAYSEYREFPNAIICRDTEQAAEERQRLLEALRQLQARLSFYQTWALLEAPEVGTVYQALLEEARSLVDKAMRIAWTEPVAADDVDMNLDPGLIDPTALTPYEQAYRESVAAHLHKLAPHWS
jgi:hypothetical protein